MSVITHPRRKSNLAKMIDAAGGLSIGVALIQAKANIEAMRGQALAVIDDQIGRLESVPAPAAGEAPDARLDQAYQAATALIDAAGPFDLTDLCRAACGLCDLIGATGPGETFDWRIVTVHARSLRLLQTLPPSATAERARILESLAAVIQRKLGQAG